MKPLLDPRRRDRRVLVEKVIGTGTATNGEPIKTWGPAWADAEGAAIHLSAEKLEGRALERFAAQQRIATTAAVFVLAWAPANEIDPATYRLKFDGRTYEITGNIELGRRQGSAVTCEAVANAPGGPDVRP